MKNIDSENCAKGASRGRVCPHTIKKPPTWILAFLRLTQLYVQSKSFPELSIHIYIGWFDEFG